VVGLNRTVTASCYDRYGRRLARGHSLFHEENNGAPRSQAREAPRFNICPTAFTITAQSVRTGCTRAIYLPSPRPANLGRRTFLEIERRPNGTDNPLWMHNILAKEGGDRCGPHNTTENPDCCYGCSGCCCRGMTRARCSGCCSRSRRDTPERSVSGHPTGNASDPSMKHESNAGNVDKKIVAAARPSVTSRPVVQ
jgi:hypothetical protein